MRRILLLAIALIVYGSLFPWRFHFVAGIHPIDTLWRSWPARFDLWTLRDAILNIVLYIPLGFTAAASLRRAPKAAAFLLASLSGFALSAAMELLQIYVPGRVSSMADVVTNTIGAACGAGLAVVFTGHTKVLRRIGRVTLPPSAVVLVGLWTVYRLYPFFPVIGFSRIARAIRVMAQGSAHPVEIWMQAAEWFALAAILRFAWPKLRIGWLAALMIVIPLQADLLDRTMTLDQVIGAAVALGIYAVAGKRLFVVAAVVLSSAIVLRELSPFYFLARPAAFLWIPFSGTFDSSRTTSVVIIAGKGFDYGAMLWLLRRVGLPLWPAAAAMACALLAFEWLQRLLPGRTPESTDAVLTLILALALWRLDGRAP